MAKKVDKLTEQTIETYQKMIDDAENMVANEKNALTAFLLLSLEGRPELEGTKIQYLFVEPVWDCPESPTGYCVYDKWDDPCLDNCLFCHDPYERK